MIRRFLPCLLIAGLVLTFAAPRALAGAKVTESDYKTYVKLEYEKALCDARKMFARRDPLKLAEAEAALAKAWKESGWTDQRFGEVEESLGEVVSNLNLAKNGELSQEDLKTALSEADPTTVATAKQHFEDLNNTNYGSRAEKQVREEIAAEKNGTPPTDAQIQGSWEFDVDATIDWLMPGMTGPEKDKIKTDMAGKMGRVIYTFGPGNAVEVRGPAPDGKEKVEHSTYRLDGNRIFFKTGQTHESDLKIGMRNGKLQMGLSFGMAVFTKK